jgi:hypothetical protein
MGTAPSEHKIEGVTLQSDILQRLVMVCESTMSAFFGRAKTKGDDLILNEGKIKQQFQSLGFRKPWSTYFLDLLAHFGPRFSVLKATISM